MSENNPINWVQEVLQKQHTTLAARFDMQELGESDISLGFGFRIIDKNTGEKFEVHGLPQKKGAKQACFHEVWKSWRLQNIVPDSSNKTAPPAPTSGKRPSTALAQSCAGLSANNGDMPAAASGAEAKRCVDASRWLTQARTLRSELVRAHDAITQRLGSEPSLVTFASVAQEAASTAAALTEVLVRLSSAATAAANHAALEAGGVVSAGGPGALAHAASPNCSLSAGGVGQWPAEPSRLLARMPTQAQAAAAMVAVAGADALAIGSSRAIGSSQPPPAQSIGGALGQSCEQLQHDHGPGAEAGIGTEQSPPKRAKVGGGGS